jgi:DNA repair exonuclease SbcCD nuclease subunit
LATELKKLEERSIPVCCVLGEHDINRDIPFTFFEDPNLARHLSRTQALCINEVSIFGFDKERKTNMASLLLGLETVQQEMKWQKEKEGKGKKNVLVLHQGITDFSMFAGEIDSPDLPRGFDYYAMGHYHDHKEKRFDCPCGLLAYPGSLDLRPDEGNGNVFLYLFYNHNQDI